MTVNQKLSKIFVTWLFDLILFWMNKYSIPPYSLHSLYGLSQPNEIFIPILTKNVS